MVLDNSLDINRVIITPNRIDVSTDSVATKDLKAPVELAINILARDISIGKRPLQGTKLFVIMAINLSLGGESMILQEITPPAALHPKPIHMVKACFPWAPAFLK